MKNAKRFIAQLQKDPFRLYFPMAVLVALYACSLWISFSYISDEFYPGLVHAELFVGGFLFFSILGFLMTAIPRFTQTHFATKNEIYLSMFLICALFLSMFFQPNIYFWLFVFGGWCLLIKFVVSRFIKRKQNPPLTFLFVGIGVLMGLAGSLLRVLGFSFPGFAFDFERLGKLLFYDGMVMSFIMGVGGRLIPGILGFQEIVASQREIYERPLPFKDVIPWTIKVSVVVFIASFLLEFFHNEQAGYLLRACVISFIAFAYWNIHKKPDVFKWHGVFLIISCWIMLIASWLLVFLGDYQIAIRHLIYIGGYSLMTFLIASRVILAHDGVEIADFEKRSFPYCYFGACFVLAALARFGANLLPDSYFNHLGYAAVCFFIGTLIWGYYYIPRVIKHFF